MRSDAENPGRSEEDEDDEVSPIEEVRLTVSNSDDPSQPIWTFRMWFLGLVSCSILSSLNQLLAYRTEPVFITQIIVQVAILPIGHFMAAVLPRTHFTIIGFGSKLFSFNPGPFNIKEHVMITIFANAGSAFGSGSPYAMYMVNSIKTLYGRNISFSASWLLVITTQVLGYGWAGLLRKYVVEPAHMWWPISVAQASLFRSVTAQQIGSGMKGLGVGALTLDWAAVASLFSPLISPFFVIVNVFVGYALMVYVVIPIAYWGLNVYNADRFPIFSSHFFTSQGQNYNITAIVDNNSELNVTEYEKQGKIHLSVFDTLTYGFGFATVASTLTHVLCFYGR